jgi:hypothetical protein
MVTFVIGGERHQVSAPIAQAAASLIRSGEAVLISPAAADPVDWTKVSADASNR